MTSIKAAGVVVLFLMALPASVAAAEVAHEEDRQVDAVHAESNLYASLVEGNQSDSEAARLDAELLAAMVPSDSQLAFLLQFLLAMQPAHESVAVADVATLDPSSESNDLMEQGVVLEGEGHATPSRVEAAGAVSAGSHRQGTGASVTPEEAITKPIAAQDAGREPAPEAVEEEAAPADDAAEEKSLGPIAQDALLATDESAVIQPIALPVALAATAVVLGTSASAAIVVVPGWRSALVRLVKRFGWLVLFSRIAQEDVLNHERRSELLEFIRNNPGERVEVARRHLGFSNGSMHYHLRVLQDRQLVRILKDGSLARLYPRGPKIVPAPYVPVQRKKFVDALSAAPGRTQRELAATLGLSERMVSYHVRALAQQGLVEIRAEGARKRLFPAQTQAVSTVEVLAPAA